jgi:riboflavin synthase
VFTGLIADIGRVERRDGGAEGARLRVATKLAADLAPGDSITVNGACLTAAAVENGGFEADVMNQTLERTSLGPLAHGDEVNLELALRAADRLGGHLVQGHVDGTGTVADATQDGLARRLDVDAPADLRRYIVERGSITVDGVSLTVAALTGVGFEVSLVPETLERTTLGDAAPGRLVNLEVDVLARYVESLMSVFENRGAPE